ncbi:NADH-quinone oxidoreductase subunit E [Agaricicola taiwanensis]|uniref:NADH-quinone oxidoreductase subunit E n=1 Tax=Agaricicola taiwanensis TaxID=591372 RepID=A0A8J3DUZ3_9RHOB|nr:NADH-quinone oxidoreductase subunit NuoE [Agaricicola taiwanensis]GGE44098.1 NADH-quinone oxidoreductase subunit E [Agaricicola taiwanensis]
MSVRRLAEQQPESFAFTPDNIAWANTQIAKYPEGRQASAVIPLLWKAQEQHGGWLPEPAIRVVADMLGMAFIRVLEVATFYTMFNLEPVGRHLVQLCGTTPCMLRGANELKDVCRKVIGPEKTLSADGTMSWLEVECLGACANAPMVQINYDYYEDLTPESFEAMLNDLRAGKDVTPGSQTGRAASCPSGGPTSLTDETLFDGSVIGAWRKRFDEAKAPEQAPTEAAKPEAPSPGEKLAADNPGERAAKGKPAIKPADQAAAERSVPASDPATSPDPKRVKPRAVKAKTSASAPGNGLNAVDGQDNVKKTRAPKAPKGE